MPIVIKKRVSFDFLGEDYASAYINFKTIPVGKLTTFQDRIPDDKNKSIPVMLDIIKEHFLDGKFPNDKGELVDISQEDLDDLSVDAAIECFRGLTGSDPKLQGDLKGTSNPMAALPPQ
jgi:hypothetical protein